MKKVTGLVIILILALLYASGVTGYVIGQPAVTPVAAEVPTQDIKTGQYTIFQYTRSGWVNREYVTDYYIEDGIIYYKDRVS